MVSKLAEEKQSTELVAKETPGPLMAQGAEPDNAALAEYVSPGDNLDGLAGSYPRIRIVHAEQMFRFPGDVTKTQFSAAILYRQAVKAYWSSDQDFTEPPRCASRDGKKPDSIVQEPIKQHCWTPLCPKNVMGSDEKGGRGKACKDMERLWLYFDPNEYEMPLQLSLPATSLRNLGNYLRECAVAGVSFCFIVTEFTLTPAGQGEQKYSKIRLRHVGPVAPDHVGLIVEWRNKVVETAQAVAVSPEDYGADEARTNGKPVSAEEAAKYGGGGVDDPIPF